MYLVKKIYTFLNVIALYFCIRQILRKLSEKYSYPCSKNVIIIKYYAIYLVEPIIYNMIKETIIIYMITYKCISDSNLGQTQKWLNA